jgi:hypothetical protein
MLLALPQLSRLARTLTSHGKGSNVLNYPVYKWPCRPPINWLWGKVRSMPTEADTCRTHILQPIHIHTLQPTHKHTHFSQNTHTSANTHAHTHQPTHTHTHQPTHTHTSAKTHTLQPTHTHTPVMPRHCRLSPLSSAHGFPSCQLPNRRDVIV